MLDDALFEHVRKWNEAENERRERIMEEALALTDFSYRPLLMQIVDHEGNWFVACLSDPSLLP